MNNDFQKVIHFWFEEIDQSFWFKKSPHFDELIRRRFSHLHQAASFGELNSWRECAHGRLAEIILLDQFSRNMYRDTPNAFAYDTMALTLAQEAIRSKSDQALSKSEKLFIYMPFMHSESKRIHQQAVEIFKNYGNAENLKFELAHKEIIDRFGRYPHRNKILGRISTAEELEFLQQPNSSF